MMSTNIKEKKKIWMAEHHFYLTASMKMDYVAKYD